MSDFREEEALGKAYDSKLLRRLMTYLRPYKWTVVFAVFLTLLVGPLEVVGPYLFGSAVDKYIVPGSNHSIRASGGSARGRLISLLSLAALLLSFAVQYLQVRMMQNVGQQTLYDLRKEIFERMQRLPMSFFDRSPVGRLVTRVTTDVDALNDLFAAGIAAMANDAIVLHQHWRGDGVEKLAAGACHVCRVAADHDFHLAVPQQSARRQPPHPHGHRAHQFVPAGTPQRHEHRADFQPREKIARTICRIESHPHGSLQGRDHRVRRVLSCSRAVQHRGHRHRLLVWRPAFLCRSRNRRHADHFHAVRAAFLPPNSGPERKIQHSAIGHGRLRAHFYIA